VILEDYGWRKRSFQFLGELFLSYLYWFFSLGDSYLKLGVSILSAYVCFRAFSGLGNLF